MLCYSLSNMSILMKISHKEHKLTPAIDAVSFNMKFYRKYVQVFTFDSGQIYMLLANCGFH